MTVTAPPGMGFMTDAVAHWAAVRPDAEALTYGEVRWTWAQWYDRIRRVAGGLAALGLGRGDRVAFLDKNNPACLEVALGAGLLGAASAGTTGRPKGVMLSHRNIVEHTQNAVPLAPMGPGDRNLVAMPLFHIGGTGYALFGIYTGAPSTFTREPDPASLLAAFAAGATHAFLVPAVVSALLAAGETAIAALSELKYLLYGAAPMPLAMLRQALAAWPGLNFVQVYGQTELAGVISALSP